MGRNSRLIEGLCALDLNGTGLLPGSPVLGWENGQPFHSLVKVSVGEVDALVADERCGLAESAGSVNRSTFNAVSCASVLHGCGGFLVELILDPIINAASGLPASAGHNTAILKIELNIASAAAVRKNNAENP